MKHQEIYNKIVDKVHKMSDNELKDSILKANPQLVNDIKLSDNYNHALELSAQCWCDKETSGIEMDDRLAKAFATRLTDKIDRINKLEQKIQKLMEAGDVMYELLNPPSPSMRTTEYDNALQGWDDAKIRL